MTKPDAILTLFHFAAQGLQASRGEILTFNIAAAEALADIAPEEAGRARAIVEAIRESEGAQLKFREMLRKPESSAPLVELAPDGIAQDCEGPHLDLPPGLHDVLRRDFEEYAAGRAEQGLRSLSWREFVTALLGHRVAGDPDAMQSLLRSAEEAAGLLCTAAS